MSDNQNSDNAAAEILEEFGFNIWYDASQDKFFIFSNSSEQTEEIATTSYKEWQKNYKKNLPKDYQTEHLKKDLRETLENLQDDKLYHGYFDFENNKLTIIEYNMNEQDRETCKKLLVEKGICDAEDADKMIDIFLNPEITESFVAHEASHGQDYLKRNVGKADLPREKMAKLNMFTEIRANMVQAGIALKKFNQTGDLSGFDSLRALDKNDVAKIKETLKNNPRMSPKQQQEFVAKTVCNDWLKKNNIFGMPYCQQAFSCALLYDNPIWSLADTQKADKEYRKRVDSMFKNVEGLGDVRKFINPEFTLDETICDLLNDLSADKLKIAQIMMADAKNAKAVAKNLATYLKKVKEVDADGIRTAKETAELKKILNDNRKKSAKNNNIAQPTHLLYTSANRQRQY